MGNSGKRTCSADARDSRGHCRRGSYGRRFRQKVLANHLAAFGVWPYPTLPGRRGGNISVQRLAAGMRELLRGFDAVTSLVDYYGFKQKENKAPDELESMVLDQLNRTVARPELPRRVFPYVQCHEFEALLFSDVERFRCIPRVSETCWRGSSKCADSLRPPRTLTTVPRQPRANGSFSGCPATTSGPRAFGGGGDRYGPHPLRVPSIWVLG